MLELNKIYNGDWIDLSKQLDNESINCIMTSPPYWALRDYKTEGQLGLEPTFDEYIKKLCDGFEILKDKLRKDGTCWVNIGDTYSTKPGSGFEGDLISKDNSGKGINKANELRGKWVDKCLCMIPFRFAIEMVNRGWILRNTIIWHKANCMPSSVKDRFTVDFEYLFFFVKNKRYWFETQREGDNYCICKPSVKMFGGDGLASKQKAARMDRPPIETIGRNKRTVWQINPTPFAASHFAVYPEKLCETPIKAGCPKLGIVLDPFAGSGTTCKVARRLGRQYIGFELNKEYIKIAEMKIRGAENWIYKQIDKKQANLIGIDKQGGISY